MKTYKKYILGQPSVSEFLQITLIKDKRTQYYENNCSLFQFVTFELESVLKDEDGQLQSMGGIVLDGTSGLALKDRDASIEVS